MFFFEKKKFGRKKVLPVVLHKLHRLCTLHLKTRYHAFKGSYDNGWHCFIRTMLIINYKVAKIIDVNITM